MFEKIKDAIANDNELDSGTLRLLSLVFLLASGAMSFFKYTRINTMWWDSQVTFQPGFESTIIAIILIAPLYMRRVHKWNKSIYTIFSLILILLVFASFVELALGGNEKNIYVMSLLASSIMLSWLGIKAVAGIGWALALVAAIYSAQVNNLAMGFYGFLYIGSGFLGLVLHSGLNPGSLVQEIKEEYSSSVMKISSSAKQDIEVAIEKVT